MTPTPKRIQRKRTKGWKMPEGAIYVGRPTKWGNPFREGDRLDRRDRDLLTAERALELFQFTTCPIEDKPGFVTDFELNEIDIRPLRGHDLACWCPLDQPCHADVLLELANSASEVSHVR
jgi:hypothetical protein